MGQTGRRRFMQSCRPHNIARRILTLVPAELVPVSVALGLFFITFRGRLNIPACLANSTYRHSVCKRDLVSLCYTPTILTILVHLA